MIIQPLTLKIYMKPIVVQFQSFGTNFFLCILQCLEIDHRQILFLVLS